MRYYTQIWSLCQRFFENFLNFFEKSMIFTVMRCFASRRTEGSEHLQCQNFAGKLLRGVGLLGGVEDVPQH